jgi:hypothetical protein
MDPLDTVPSQWPLALALLIGLAIVFFWRRSDFVIRVRRKQVTFRGKLPLRSHQGIAEFLLKDLDVQGPVTILGRRDRGRMKVWFRGRLTQGQQQRVRNFLLTHL